MSAAPQQTEQFEIQNDCLIDLITGENLGVVTEEFHVTNEDSARKVMRRLLKCDLDVANYEAEKAALVANCDKAIKRAQNRRTGLLWRYQTELEEYAKNHAPKGSKTWLCPEGEIAFKVVRGGLRVKDAEAALELAKKLFPGAIKTTREFQISKLDASQKTMLGSAVRLELKEPTVDALVPKAFEWKPDKEEAYISTGVKPQPAKDTE